MGYNLINIRSLLTEGFSDAELRQFCFDTPGFKPVYHQLAQTTGKADIVSLLLDHAERKVLFDPLLAWAREQNPERFTTHQPYEDDSPSAQARPAPTSTIKTSPVPETSPNFPTFQPSTPPLHRLRVFLCHTAADKPAVRDLYHRLQADGFQPWLDEEDLLPGQKWQREIPKAVRNADVVIVCLSQAALTKAGYVQEEIKFALDVADQQPEDSIFIIPLRLEECDVPNRLQDLHWVNLFEERGYGRLMRALREKAKAEAEPKPDSKPSSPSTSPLPNPQPPTPTRLPFEPEMILIPAGDFVMGSDPKRDKDAIDNEQPQHTLYLPDYYLAKTLITNAQYVAFVQASGHRTPNADVDWAKPYNWQGQTPPAGKKNHPVVLVSWDDAVAYCHWLAETAGKPYRLPTEAEWEKGARGPDGRIYPWGNKWDAKRCNSREGSQGGTTPVDAYPNGASPYGLLDMAGNAWEWCSTIWQERAYPFQVQDEWAKTYLARTDVRRVLRGGAFTSAAHDVRCAARYRNNPYISYDLIGFRVVLPPK